MPPTPKILAFAGSARTGSYNKMLVKVAATGARRAGADVTYVDLRDFAMPVYDADLESREGLPENAVRFKQLMKSHDGLLIASPENNGSYSSLLKNTIDWASRRYEGESGRTLFAGKVAGIMSAAPGALGGVRGLPILRILLVTLGVIVIPDQRAVPKARDAFTNEGDLKDEKMRDAIHAIGTRVTEVVTALAGN